MPKRLVYRVGINDSKEPVYDRVDGKQVRHKDYALWQSMLGRCYGKLELLKDPSYQGCTVTPKWHKFSGFQKWLETQDWEGKQLDKDILKIDNKVYGPETCCFVSGDINALLHINNPERNLPVGVYKSQKRYQVSFGNRGLKVHLGRYQTPEEAHIVYRISKAEYVREKALEVKDLRIREGLLRHAESLWPTKLVEMITNPCFPKNFRKGG